MSKEQRAKVFTSIKLKDEVNLFIWEFLEVCCFLQCLYKHAN